MHAHSTRRLWLNVRAGPFNQNDDDHSCVTRARARPHREEYTLLHYTCARDLFYTERGFVLLIKERTPTPPSPPAFQLATTLNLILYNVECMQYLFVCIQHIPEEEEKNGTEKRKSKTCSPGLGWVSSGITAAAAAAFAAVTTAVHNHRERAGLLWFGSFERRPNAYT